MPIPDFIVELRELIGHRHLWLPGVTAVVRRNDEILEETGVTARVDRLASSWVHGPITHANGDLATYLDLTFACTWLAGEPYVADDESSAVAWVRRADLTARRVSAEMLRRIDAALSDETAARFVR